MINNHIKIDSNQIISHRARERVVIVNITPRLDDGLYAIKRALGEKISINADIFCDGHDEISCFLAYEYYDKKFIKKIPMNFRENDKWEACFTPDELGYYFYWIEAWIDEFKTLQKIILIKLEFKQEINNEVSSIIDLVTKHHLYSPHRFTQIWLNRLNNNPIDIIYDEELTHWMSHYNYSVFSTKSPTYKAVIEPHYAYFGAWYEVFPRSLSTTPGKHGNFSDLTKYLPHIKKMGFDIVYLPPIHPIGYTARKGKNNQNICSDQDVGCPWAIGSKEGGHMAVHPALGTLNDFKLLIAEAEKINLKIALDFALQCSPDHPYLKLHQDWFKYKPDGTLQFAENPPKKYEDVFPFNFATDDWQQLWHECYKILSFWVDIGVKIFRVDNPHTKPFTFWEWLIRKVKYKYPDVIFLSEAFTRPNIMYHLAKIGFSQSYTYFTWRNDKAEITQYIKELNSSPIKEYFWPNFWPNTPDILPKILQDGGKPAFITRFILAATLSTNYGIYGPAFEYCINTPLERDSEEYLNSEKYEIRQWQINPPKEHIIDVIKKVNQLRKSHPALQNMQSLIFHPIQNNNLICYSKKSAQPSDNILVIVNLDSKQKQSGNIDIPLNHFGIKRDHYKVYDLLNNTCSTCHGSNMPIDLDPKIMPVCILHFKE